MPYNVLGGMTTLSTASNVVSSNPCVLLTRDNDVIFCADLAVSQGTANQVLATLPEGFRPKENVSNVSWLSTSLLTEMTLAPNGELTLSTDVVGEYTVKTNGMKFNISDAYYNSEIGNNFPQGTTNLQGY